MITQAELKLKTWTIEEYHQMIDAGVLDDQKVELLRGKIVEMVPEREPHAAQSQDVDRSLARLLEEVAWVRQAKLITLPNQSEPEPDICVCQPLGRECRTHHPYPEKIYWLIEYSNTSLNRDLTYKLKLYAEAGIFEYWVVDIGRSQLIVYQHPLGDSYRSEATYETGTIFSMAFPTLPIEVLKIINP